MAARRVSRDDWTEWLRRLSVELLKESPSPTLRSCQVLAQEYNPLARLGLVLHFVLIFVKPICSHDTLSVLQITL